MKRVTVLQCLAGIMLMAAASVAGAGTSDGIIDAAKVYISSTKSLSGLSGAKHVSLSSNGLKGQPKLVQAVPESNTMAGFGVALALNGLGVAGSGYYLRRKYNRESAKRYAGRHVARLPLFLDTALSVTVLLVVSPVLMAIAAAGALKTGVPKVYGATGLQAASDDREITGIKAV